MTGGFRDLKRTPGGSAHRRLPARLGAPLIALGAVSLVAVIAVVVALLVHVARSGTDTATDETSAMVSALEVPVGACVDSAGLTDPNMVLVVSCLQPHDATVYARLKLSPVDVTTDDLIRSAADKACQAAVPQSAGTDVQVSFYYPTAEDAADNADRRLSCVFDTSGDPTPSS